MAYRPRPEHGLLSRGANLPEPEEHRHGRWPGLGLPLDDIELPKDWFNMYWRYGQKILTAAEVIAEVKAKAKEIRGVKIVKQSKYLRHFTAEMAWA